MAKGNGKDEAQQAAGQKAADQQPEGAGAPARLPVMGLIVIDPENGSLMLQVNEQVIQDKLAFFLAVAQLGLGNAMGEQHQQPKPKVLRPKPQGIIKPPGL